MLGYAMIRAYHTRRSSHLNARKKQGNLRGIAVLLLIAGLLSVLTACGARKGNSEYPAASASSQPTPSPTAEASPTPSEPTGKKPIVTIEMESGKTITIELYPDIAPNTVNNFISLIKKGFYDGLGFHRVIPGFMIQGGDPEGTGSGGPGYNIKGEFTENGFKNDLKHTRGVLSMARLGNDMDSIGSQFFIMVADYPSLDGLYSSFGKVTSGMETVDEIVGVPVSNPRSGSVVTAPIMKKVTVDTLGDTYPEPEKVS